MGGTELTTYAKESYCTGHSLRSVRSVIIVRLMFLLLVGYGQHAYSQTTPAAPAAPTTPAAPPSQTRPSKVFDFGVGGVSGSSFKFGEYNGLQNSGPFGIANFDVRGCAAYDSSNTLRWRMKGTDLGLEVRSLYAEIGHQGKFRFYASYSELRANRSDTVQTPYS